MKARLAKKLVCTRFDRLAPRWRDHLCRIDRFDARFDMASIKYQKMKRRNSKIKFISKEKLEHIANYISIKSLCEDDVKYMVENGITLTVF